MRFVKMASFMPLKRGVQLPALTKEVLRWWFHVIALVAFAIPCV